MEVEEVRAAAKYVRVSSTKVQRVAMLIRGKPVDEAESILAFCGKGAANPLGKVLKSAIANAERNHNFKRDELYVSEAFANQGPTLKRFKARAMGRGARIRKRTSHIMVVLREI